MRKTAFASLFALSIAIAASSSSSVSAFGLLQVNDNKATVTKPLVVALSTTTTAASEVTDQPAPPVVQEYTVVEGDSLSKIATAHNTDWKRLFDKNESIENPDIITIGANIVIPAANDVLPNRPIPEPPAPVVEPEPIQPEPVRVTAREAEPQPSTQTVAHSGSVAGNTYTAGACTWYVKNRRPDLPNNLGNASTWASRARAQGIPTGSTPRVGAVGQRGNHVVYVERVNGDGTVTISEMNYNYVAYSLRTNTRPASYFTYIY